MGSAGALVCSAACVLLLLSSASTDDRDMEQRAVTFDQIMLDMEQKPQAFISQTEVDLSDIFDAMEFPGQVESTNNRGGSGPGVLRPIRRYPDFVPRSFGGPPILDYPVQFPLGRPTTDNLQAICLNGEHRPTYSKSYFPASGFGFQKLRAKYVNKGESWLSTCCNGNQEQGSEVTLCCATQAWELFVKSFCEEDTSIKHRMYHCCLLRGDDNKLKCFQNDSPNPNYEGTEELPVPPLPSTDDFSFDPNTCQRTVMTPRGLRGNRRKEEKKPSVPQKVDMSFPPGRPTADNIERLCQDQRPLYTTNCLTGPERKRLARQAKTINRMEKGFKRCCKKKQEHVLSCADEKWLEELDKFCIDEKGGHVDFHCCLSNVSNDRLTCFQEVSPDPHYNMTSATKELSLHDICDTRKIIKKKFPVRFLLTSFVDQCCPLSADHKTACFEQKLEEISAMCSSRNTFYPAARRCCRTSSQESAQCLSKVLMGAISKSTTASHQKKKKRCPLS